MRLSVRSVAATAAILSAGVVTGSALKYCPSNADGVCYSVGVPSSSAAAGSGNIYFQITAPTSYQWVALGPGTSMSNSYMFIVYEDGGGNMTVSPRKGTPHSTPQLDTSGSAAKLTLLAGSGVSADGKTMTANVQCANCDSLPGGGKLTLADTKSGWIAAWKSGPSFATTSTSQRINIHDDTTEFQLDLTKATLGSDSNPFWHDEASSGGGGSGSDTGSGSGSDSGSGSGSGSGSDSGSGSGSGSGTGSDDSGSDTGSSGGNADSDGGSDSGGGVTVIPDRKSDNIAILIVTHGIIMAVVMVALYPIGSLMMPVLGKWAAHATFQMVSFTLMWIGFGIGVKSAMATDILFKQPHTILGTAVVCGFLIQPALGLLHHRYYVRKKPQAALRYGHIWYGRLLMAIGLVNGGLGMKLSRASAPIVIGYGVAIGVIFLLYLAVVAIKGYRTQIEQKKRGEGSDD